MGRAGVVIFFAVGVIKNWCCFPQNFISGEIHKCCPGGVSTAFSAGNCFAFMDSVEQNLSSHRSLKEEFPVLQWGVPNLGGASLFSVSPGISQKSFIPSIVFPPLRC